MLTLVPQEVAPHHILPLDRLWHPGIVDIQQPEVRNDVDWDYKIVHVAFSLSELHLVHTLACVPMLVVR